MKQVLEKIEEYKKQFEEELKKVESLKAFEELRVKYLGRKAGIVKSLLDLLRTVDRDFKPKLGQEINKFKVFVEQSLKEAGETVKKKQQELEEKKKFFDITLPGFKSLEGGRHPLTITRQLIEEIFVSMGYDIASGPEVESDWYNFEALGIPKTHPARDTQDTFYISEDVVLRTHTSNVQIHVMKTRKPPFKVIMPGRVYRKDADITHSPMFHQVEGLVVGENITFQDLKGTLDTFLKKLFGENARLRLRPSFFPFTEPSAEVDVSCIMCGGEGCRVCKGSGWLEILGAGMVDPVVFENVGYDPEKVTGFAFGLGVERIAMLKYGISDIRLFFDNDIRFLKQFR